MAAAEAADVTNLVLLEVRFERVMQFVLRSGTQASTTVANEDLFAFVLFFQEVVEANSTERDGIAEQMILAHLVNEFVRFGCAALFGGFDHAFEDVFFDAFTKREGAEVFGHGSWEANAPLSASLRNHGSSFFT